MTNIQFVDGWFVEEMEAEPDVFKKIDCYLPASKLTDQERSDLIAKYINQLSAGTRIKRRALSGSGSPNNTKYFVEGDKLVPCRPFGGTANAE
jgi:hypothetical protein